MEIDIANSFGIINAMNSAHSVRVILVISKDDIAYRIAGLKKLADNLYQCLMASKENDSKQDDIEDSDDTDDYTDSDHGCLFWAEFRL